MNIDETDRKIIRHLLGDARLSARQLGLRLGMSTVTILSRIKKMEKERLIRGYAAALDHEKLGYALTAIIELSAKKDMLVEVESSISEMQNICAVYDITGSTDTIIIAKFKDRDALSDFVKGLSSIPGVTNTITHVVLNTAKEDFRLS